MDNILLHFIKTRDWLVIFIRFSAFMFWFHVAIAVGIMIFQPMREAFIDWIVLHNSEYFTIVYKDAPMPIPDNSINIEMM